METKTKFNSNYFKAYSTGEIADELNRRLALAAGKQTKVIARFLRATNAELEAELASRQAACPPFVKSATTGAPVRNTVAGILGSWSSR